MCAHLYYASAGTSALFPSRTHALGHRPSFQLHRSGVAQDTRRNAGSLNIYDPIPHPITNHVLPALQLDLEQIIMTTSGELDPAPHIVRVGAYLPKAVEDVHVSLLDEIPDIKGCVGPSVTRVTGIAKPHYVLFQSVGGTTKGFCKPWPESPDFYPRAGHQFVTTQYPQVQTTVPFGRVATAAAATAPNVCY